MKPATQFYPHTRKPAPIKLLLACSLLLGSLCLSARDLHVSVDGKLGNRGEVQAPLPSVTSAVELARKWRVANPGKRCRILLHRGIHELAETLVLDSRDSGTTFLGEPGAVVSGGTALKLRGKLENGDWAMSLPDDPLPEQLYVDGGWGTIARAPDIDEEHPFLTFQSYEHNAPPNSAADSFSTRTVFTLQGELPADFPKSGYTLAVMKSWSLFRQRVESGEGSSLVLPNPTWLDNDTSGGPTPNIFSSGESSHYRGWFEGHPHFISRPGEWGTDAEKRELIYRPREGETPEKTRLVVPHLTRLVRIEGTAGKPVKDLTFEGIRFRHSADYLPAEGLDTRQAGTSYLAYYLEKRNGTLDFDGGDRAAVSARHFQNGAFTECEFSALGKHGIQIGAGCRDVSLTGCHFKDTGGGGVLIGTALDPENEADQVKRIRLTDSLVENTGRHWAGSIGIWQGFAAESEIAHNRVRNLSYSGISMGWQWDDKPTMAGKNRIHHNHISDVMLMLGDGGGIYTIGNQPDSTIEANLVHGVHRSEYNHGAPNNGIYPDQGSSGFTITKNIVFDIVSSPIRFHRAGGMQVDVMANVLVPSAGISAATLSPPYGGDLQFKLPTENLTEQVVWEKNTILTPEKWNAEKAELLDESAYGPRGKWRKALGLE